MFLTEVRSRVEASSWASQRSSPLPVDATRCAIDFETLNSGDWTTSRSRLRAAATRSSPSSARITKPRSAPTSAIACSRIRGTSREGSASWARSIVT